MFLFRTVAPVVILASAAYLGGAARPLAENVYTPIWIVPSSPGTIFTDMPTEAGSRAAIPPGQSSYDTRAILKERTSQRVRDLIQDAAASQPAKGSAAQKVGDYYASFRNESAIEAKGLEPLAGEMATIAAITERRRSQPIGSTLNTEVDGLTANADHVFGVWVNKVLRTHSAAFSTCGRAAWEYPTAKPIWTRRRKRPNCAVSIRRTLRRS